MTGGRESAAEADRAAADDLAADTADVADTGDGAPPRSLIVTVFGLYVREFGGWVGVGTLIRLLEPLGVDAQAVRSAVSRLKRRGILVAEKRGTTAGYALSDVAREILALGDRRIFSPPPETGEEWVMVVFSVPESERKNRHALRTRLSGMGFGNVTSGVWVAPAHLAEDARVVLARAGLDGYADVFAGSRLISGDVADRVGQWWNLDELASSYERFVVRVEPLVDRWRAADPSADPAGAFADYVRVLTAWRRLPYRDPGLPASLLPESWPGVAARDLFGAVRELLEKPAHAYVDEAPTPR
ncbi:PaaX family transcriptional regulator [Rhodococcoides corynebacterioides]|uniref:PaaX family transcriptional regulator n=1 Tax=Rhodococcoides corynebacterioides TaxID=53972 RepID=A0ABS7NZ33_9NOCA|nr:PaaX family transcriptional regulator C-terminal domain-containing protein [Rhodococcus corynebacterioides]MBY6365401.1 PaaX family transcriptional regulator [Rhodococcus corynebacterioides]MBY6407945.1 PaaX family transcriptional regulator [Rhodococcus corynebacterioides]